ncbi:PadR family transcriptional regulator [Candidatus Micrarchaeota archaeon]|nr:PadR family transcriptional regulator [Candidatus Micrarchaeota archaeon]
MKKRVPGQFIVMMILWMLNEEPRSGYDIVKDFKKNGIPLSYSFIYPTLFILRHKGFVTVKEKCQGKRKRKVYRLTSAGRKYLHRLKEDWMTPLKRRFLEFLLE